MTGSTRLENWLEFRCCVTEPTLATGMITQMSSHPRLRRPATMFEYAVAVCTKYGVLGFGFSARADANAGRLCVNLSARCGAFARCTKRVSSTQIYALYGTLGASLGNVLEGEFGAEEQV